MEWTQEQLNIFGVDLDVKKILTIMALSGSAKTTSAVEIIRRNPHLRFLYVSFSEAIVTAVRKDIVGLPNAKASTINSYAFQGSVSFRMGRPVINITIDKIGEYFNMDISKKSQRTIAFLTRRMFKEYCLNTLSPEEYKELKKEELLRASLSSKDKKNMFKAVDNAVALYDGISKGKTKYISHESYLKYFMTNGSMTNHDYDYIIVDEAQDLNDIMFTFVEEQAKTLIDPHSDKKVGVIAIGDQNQGIYGFLESKNIIETLNKNYPSTQKSLTRSFRFGSGSRMEKVANMLLHSRGEHVQGVACYPDDILRNIAFLGRNNLQVIKKCVELIENKENFSLLGGVSSLDLDTIFDIAKMGGIYHNKIKSDFIRGFKTKFDLKKWAQEEDAVDVLMAINVVNYLLSLSLKNEKNEYEREIGRMVARFSGRGGFIKKIIDIIEMKSKKTAPYIVSTYHKSKGLGVDGVELMENKGAHLDDIYIPYGWKSLSGRSKKLVINGQTITEYQLHIEDEKKYIIFDEYNLMYVAVTRAKKELVILDEVLKTSMMFVDLLFKEVEENNSKEGFYYINFPEVKTRFKIEAKDADLFLKYLGTRYRR